MDTLTENTKALSIQNLDKEIKSLIKKAKDTNPIICSIDIIPHKIDLNEKLVNKFKNYTVPIAIREEVRTHLNELEKSGIIRKEYSNFISPAFILRKSNGKLRLVVDYRELNKVTDKTSHFLPKISEILSNMSKAKVFSKIDLNKGYYQIKMNKDDISKTGFRILNECFVFLRMPFGLCNAPRTFQ
ncbi:Retrovirus-related Pol polyprotein from transposon 17.6, partial [Dictyocoela muelleri]